ncbi:MAG: peptide ABC transporter substrate-binding protein [Planctomycetota bacterium]
MSVTPPPLSPPSHARRLRTVGPAPGRWRRWAALAGLALVAAFFVRIALAARLSRADLVINNGTEIASLDPATVTGVPEGRVMRAIFEGLVAKHPRTLAPLPGMAERWELSPDGRTYTFHLRPSNRWSNGDAFTAHDFHFSWERLLRPMTAAEYAYLAWSILGAEAYTLLDPDDLYAGTEALTSVALEQLAPGRVRLAPTAFALAHAVGAAPGDRPAVGAALDVGAPLWTLAGRAAPSPLAGRVLARGDAHVELEVDENAVRNALAAGRLANDEDWRATAFSFVGVRVIDDYTLEVELHSPTPYFLGLTGFYPFFPVHRGSIERAREEFPSTWQVEWLDPSRLVTNGPFRVSERRINDRIRLVKNERYWDAERVAMRSIDVLAVESYVTMLNLYLTGEVDWIDRIASNLVPRLLKRQDFQPEPYLGTYFYRVNVTRPPLNDVRVRRALALAIPRLDVVEKIVKAGQLPNFSMMPHGVTGYAKPEMEHAPRGSGIAEADAFRRDCDEARRLLAEAGFAGGAGLRTIVINYNTSEAHRDIAEVLAASWKNELGIDVKLENQEWKVYLDTQRTLDFDLSRSAWIGDYDDPNTFSELWVTGGDNNRTGWGDERYDDLIHRAAREADPKERMRLLVQAEEVLMEELPILPIYTYVTQNVVNPRLGGFYENSRDEHFMKWFYWRDDAELEEFRSSLPAGLERVPAPGPTEGQYPPAGRDAVVR